MISTAKRSHHQQCGNHHRVDGGKPHQQTGKRYPRHREDDEDTRRDATGKPPRGQIARSVGKAISGDQPARLVIRKPEVIADGGEEGGGDKTRDVVGKVRQDKEQDNPWEKFF